jgi:GT2 family glycosyltransferase
MSNVIHKVDAIICMYNEEVEKINFTLNGCLSQTYLFNKIFLVDNGSTIKFDKSLLLTNEEIQYIELPANKGISGARNAALKLSNAEFIACLNIDVVLDKNWLQQGLSALEEDKNAGCVFGEIIPDKDSLLSKWRMRFHEIQFNKLLKYTHFAPGHAVLFRKKAMDEVDGYNESLRLVMEDSDICERIKIKGYETLYSPVMLSTSFQSNDIELLSKKHIVRIGGATVEKNHGFSS